MLLVAGAFAGGLAAAKPLSAGRFDPYRKLAIFSKVLSYIENNYVEDISESDLMYGAARGLTDVLDPHSRFMDPDEYERLRKETEGDSEITGIGIDLEKRKRGLVVISPIEGSPAAGTVRRVEAQPQGGFAVVTAHPGGWVSVLGGLRDVSVNPGDAVESGGALGLAGRNLDGAVVVSLELWHGRGAVDPGPLVESSSHRHRH